MRAITLCAVVSWAVVVSACSLDRNSQSSDTAQVASKINEPVIELTEMQKQSGSGYWALTVSGSRINETVKYVCSEGSRGMYLDDIKMTRVLARSADNPKTVLMVDFNGKHRGEYMLNPKTSDTVLIVVGVANSDNTMRFSGTMDKNHEGALQVERYLAGGYVEGTFGGVMNIDKEPHSVQGRFKVRMR